jgi:hypothetical protein
MTIGAVSKDIFRKALLSLGFIENKSRDHVYFEYYYKGKKILETKIFHGSDKVNTTIFA